MTNIAMEPGVNAGSTPRTADVDVPQARALAAETIGLVRRWLTEASKVPVDASAEQLAGVLKDPNGLDFTVGFVDGVVRPEDLNVAARNLAALGVHAGIMGVLGQDEAGNRVEQLLREAGIDTRLVRDPQFSTTVKLRVLGRRQQLLRIDFEGTPSHDVLLDKLAQYTELLPDYGLVVLSDYGKGGLAHISEQIRLARQAGKRVLVDPKGEDYSKYAGASLLTPNRGELRKVVGQWKSEDDLRARAQGLRAELGIDGLLLTRSEEGMTLYLEGEELHVPAQTREVFDVSGAGDTVIATVAAALAAGADIRDAVRLGNKAGGIVVGKVGTAVITPEELFAG